MSHLRNTDFNYWVYLYGPTYNVHWPRNSIGACTRRYRLVAVIIWFFVPLKFRKNDSWLNERKLICVYSDRKEHKYTFEVYDTQRRWYFSTIIKSRFNGPKCLLPKIILLCCLLNGNIPAHTLCVGHVGESVQLIFVFARGRDSESAASRPAVSIFPSLDKAPWYA